MRRSVVPDAGSVRAGGSVTRSGGADQELQDVPDGVIRDVGLWQREVRLDAVVVASAYLALDDVARFDQVGDDAMGTALGDVDAGCDLAQASLRVGRDA